MTSFAPDERPPRRSRAGSYAAAVVLALATAAAGFFAGRHFASPHTDEKTAEGGDSHEESAPVAAVRTAPVRRGMLARTVVAYGPVVAPPGSVRVASATYEAR